MRTPETLALVVIGVIATLTLGMLPLFAGGIVATHGWSDRYLGWIASADLAGSALGCLAVIRSLSRLAWHRVAWTAIAVVVAANLLSAWADGFPELVALRMLAGAGNGIVLAIVYTGLCHSGQPDRNFGLYTFGQLASQAGLLAFLPGWIAAQGPAVMFHLLAAASAMTAMLVFLVPNGLAPSSVTAGAPSATPVRAQRGATIALLAQAIYFLAPAALWSYFEAFGRGFALSLETIGRALGSSALAGMVGALAVIACGARCPRLPCMAAGTVVSAAAVACLLAGQGLTAYVAAACLFNFAWNFTFPYQMGVLAANDRDGSVATLSLIVQLVALASGPAIAALLLTTEGYGRILWGSLACYAMSFALFARAVRQ